MGEMTTRERFRAALDAHSMYLSNIFGRVGTEAAYRYGEKWLNDLMQYLEGNFQLVRDRLAETGSGFRVDKPQATYHLWLDCRELGMSIEELEDLSVK